jgi:hypothetical protein
LIPIFVDHHTGPVSESIIDHDFSVN